MTAAGKAGGHPYADAMDGLGSAVGRSRNDWNRIGPVSRALKFSGSYPPTWRQACHHRWPLGAGLLVADDPGRRRHRLDGDGHRAAARQFHQAQSYVPALRIVPQTGALRRRQSTGVHRSPIRDAAKPGPDRGKSHPRGRNPRRHAGFRRHAGGRNGGCRCFRRRRQWRHRRAGPEFQSAPAQGRHEFRHHL